jgi:TonB-dependent receptor
MVTKNFGARLLGSTALAMLMVAPAAYAQTADNTVDTVTVTASRQTATAVKRDAPNVIDIQPVTEIQKLPDVNLAEALQRVPGVSLETDSGEGRFVNIRGMDADLNGTSFDGVRLTASNASSPQGGGRAVAFDAFPSGIMGGVEVIKSLTPDIDAEGLGGVVNLLPRTMPTDRSTLVEGSLGTGVENLRGSPVWDGQATGGVRFGDQDNMSALLSYDYHSDWRGIDDIEEDYLNGPPDKAFDDLQMRWYKYHRTRQGVGGGFTYDVNDSTSFYVRGFHSGYTEYASKHRLELDSLGDDGTGAEPVPSADGTYSVPTVTAKQVYTDSKETVANNLVEAGGKTSFANGILVDFRGSWTAGSDVVPWSYGFTFEDPNNIALTYNNRNAATPSFKTTDGTDLTNPANYSFDRGDNGPGHNSDSEVAGAANVTIPLAFDDNDGILKFGGSVRGRIRRAIASAADLDDEPTLLLSDISSMIDQVYYYKKYHIGPMADLSALKALPQDKPVADPSTFEHDNENVYAGYIQYSATFNVLSVLAGVRVESTDATYNANQINQDGDVIGPSQNKQNYTNVFPDVNLKYKFNDDFQIHAAFTTAIARPGFNQITAARSLDFDNLIVSEGNPDLKATTGKNYDLSAEYYLPSGGLLSAGLFYKDFSNYIIPTVSFTTTYPNPILNGQNVEIDSFSNIGSAHAEGVELQYIQQFKGLPEPLDGLGFDGNLTYVESRGEIRIGEQHTLPQTSPFTYNAAIFYEKGPVEFRIAASYVSRNLWAVGSDASGDDYSTPRFRLDFGGSYAITDNFDWYADVKNITNTKLEFTQTKSSAFPIQREMYGPDYLTGIRVHL